MSARNPRRLFGGQRVEDEGLLRDASPSNDAGGDGARRDEGAGGVQEQGGAGGNAYAELESPAVLGEPLSMSALTTSKPARVHSNHRRPGRSQRYTSVRKETNGESGDAHFTATSTPASAGGNTIALGTEAPPPQAPAPSASVDADSLREVYFNYEPGNAVFDKCSNVVVTSKYTVITFLPKFLKESFTKIANFFFLMVCVLQSIPSISNTYGYPTNAPVLLFVISIDAVFAIMEDRRRHQSDHEANSAKCHIVRHGAVEDHLWSDVKVGDFLQVRNREVIPADLLILAVSEPVGEAASGICYVETKSLDGETNLKLRQAIPATMSALVNPQELLHLRGVVKFEKPNPYINKFAGKVEVTVSEGCGMEVMPLSVKNVLLRGCNLRNTDWVFGLVLNTGPDSKIMQSATAAPSKFSDVMLTINKMIGFLCVGLFLACAAAAACYVTWQYDIIRNTWYIQLSESDASESRVVAFIKMLFYYFLLLYQVIPISLYVSMTSVKFLQARFMSWDREMYHAETDTPAIVRTMELNEELGQISYVFSDKTGTLTCNVMEFRKCSINGISYGSGITEIGRAALLRAGKPIPAEPKLDPSIQKTPFVNFVDPSLFHALKGGAGAEQQAKVHQFFEHLAVCHTVIPEKLETGEVRLSASSPDEQALVAGATFAGFKFESRSVGKATVEVLGKREVFDVLDVLEFNSTRKRMSVVVRRPNGELLLYCKGADMMIYQRLREDPAMERIKTVTRDQMEKYADDGLRTLAIAVKRLDERWFQRWKMKFDEAQGNVGEIDRRKEGKPNAIDDLMEEIEQDLELIGATAIEDKLQDGVPQCLANLTRAGVKVWMLTGDKEETAINIAYACSLLDNSIQQVVINCTSCPTEESIRTRLVSAAREFVSSEKGDNSREISLIIDGEALELALKPGTSSAVLEFTKLCRAVICNRVSPAQKAEMVRLVRDNLSDVRTLAIGDGANDVAMIQAAHVGVGISGQEGMQAVNSSDYAIAQFRFLERLLLVHGRWNYIRISKLVLYMFYKNITFVLAQYWYGYLSGGSGSKIYWEIGVQLYNVAFTGLPIIVVGVMDKDLPAPFSAEYPDLYRKGPQRAYFNFYTFCRWIGAAFYESVIIFVVMAYGYNASDTAAGSESRVEFGMVAFTMVVLVVNLKVCMITDTWTFISLACWLGSVLSWFAFAALGTEVPYFATYKVGYDEYGAFAPTAESWGFVLVVLMGCILALGRHVAYNLYKRTFFPELSHVLQESMRTKRRRLTINHVEEQTLSMSLDDVHTTGFLDDFQRSDVQPSKVNHVVGVASLSQPQSQPSYPGKPNHRVRPKKHVRHAGYSDEQDEQEAFESVGSVPASVTASESAPLAESFSASVYSHSVTEEELKWDKVPTHQFRGTSSRRNTGYAFSCDEETTLAESYIASNSLPRSDAVPAALRNSLSSAHRYS